METMSEYEKFQKLQADRAEFWRDHTWYEVTVTDSGGSDFWQNTGPKVVRFNSCPKCRALVASEDTGTHADWHLDGVK